MKKPDKPLDASVEASEARGSAEQSLPGMFNAVVALQKRNYKAVTTGFGIGLTASEMAEHLERESGFRDLYEALELMCAAERDLPSIRKAHAALAKARGESSVQSRVVSGDDDQGSQGNQGSGGGC